MPDAPIRYRSVRMRALTPDEGPEGAFEALGAAYGVTYDTFDPWRGPMKERLAPGVFGKSIAEKSMLPTFWLHGWDMAPVGDSTASEVDNGTRFRGGFYVEDDPFAKRVYRGVKSGALDEWSIGWIAEDTHMEKEDDEDVEVADRGRLVELSAVVLGSNPGTATISVRSRHRTVVLAPPTDDDLLVRMRSLMPQLASAPVRGPIAEDEARRMFSLVIRGLMTQDEAVRLIVEGGGVGADRNR